MFFLVKYVMIYEGKNSLFILRFYFRCIGFIDVFENYRYLFKKDLRLFFYEG